MAVTIISSPSCNKHNMGEGHPEQAARLHQINDQLIASGLESVLQFANATKAISDFIALAHNPVWVKQSIKQAPKEIGERKRLDDDTYMMLHSLDAALYAAGAVKDGVDLVTQNLTNSVFCAVRPPGHHAGHASSAGFCIFNNVAIGAKYALDVLGFKRVAIVDFDVHHGDGTQDIVKDDARIMFCSSFEHPLYPFSGNQASREGVLNVPIPAGTSGKEYQQLVKHWFVALDKFGPELVFISAGFDGHLEDDLASLKLLESDYIWLTQQIKQVADKHCQGKIVSVLEGGYALSALARSVVAHIKVLNT